MREVADGAWSLPGGWADLGDAPGRVAQREVLEETGHHVHTSKLLAVYDRARHEHPPSIWHIYKLFFLCRLDPREPVPFGHETLEIGFFGQDELPHPLSTSRVTHAQLLRMFEHLRNPDLPTDFD
jgi:ADP-ribose pyrophosphatase YjhB (NUDIX family)